MQELLEIPEEFSKPILPCLELIKGCVIIFDKELSFWKRYWRNFIVIPCLVLYITSIFQYLCEVFRGGCDFVELAYVVSIYVVCNQTILKATVVAFNKKEIRAFILKLGSMWRTGQLTEVQINKKNVLQRRLKFCYAAFYWMNMLGSWQYILAPLFQTVFRKYILRQECELLLPFPCSFPFDPTGNWLTYIGVYAFETFSMLCIVYNYLGCEFLMITLCSHLATEFTLLREDLIHVKPVVDDVTDEADIQMDKNREIKSIIRRHQEMIELAEQLDSIFNKMIFVNLSAAGITICFFGLSAMVARTIIDMASNFVGVVALVLPIFNLCYYGELLREASSGMADSAYNNLWFKGDTKYGMYMLFVIRRAQKPCTLTSLKYKPIALSTFTSVMSSAWSYFSLALNFYEDDS